MQYDKDQLFEYYVETAEGRDEETYTADAVNALLDTWISEETGQKLYRLTGKFWEVLFPILKRYVPEKLETYEKLVGEEFDTFNEQVKKLVDYEDEHLNCLASITYYNNRFQYASPNDVEVVNDPETDEDIAYLPNQSINTNDYLGRE